MSVGFAIFVNNFREFQKLWEKNRLSIWGATIEGNAKNNHYVNNLILIFFVNVMCSLCDCDIISVHSILFLILDGI